jgi:hypothetical protein
MRADIADLRGEIAMLKGDIGMVRADVATLRLDSTTRLGTIIDELAAFRAEYNRHTHGE